MRPCEHVNQPQGWPRDDLGHYRETCAACGDRFATAKVVRLFGGRAYHERCWWGYRPRVGEAEQLWRRCQPVTKDAGAMAYLRSRKLGSGAYWLDLIRVIPQDLPAEQHPSWASWRRERLPDGRLVSVPWARDGYRLVVPVYDELGRMRALRGWRWEPVPDVPADWSPPKRCSPRGVDGRGLIMANAAGLRLLRGELLPLGAWDLWRRDDIRHVVGELYGWVPGGPWDEGAKILLCEGEPDWATWATICPDWCVLGYYAGSWSPELAARIPVGSDVYVRPHDDEAGERYLGQIAESLKGSGSRVWAI